MISRRRTIVIFTGLSFISCRKISADDEVQTRQVIAHPEDASAQVEFFLETPVGLGPHPGVILLHGHQSGFHTLGGEMFSRWGELKRLSAMGFAVAAISLPGFGGSTGAQDFAGPFAQASVGSVISHLEQTGITRPDFTILQGISLGAVTGALLAAKDPRIIGLILISGAYDLPSLFASQTRSGVAEIRSQFNRQTDGSLRAMRERSALLYATKIKARTLILNGARDDRTDPAQSTQFSEAIIASGGQAESFVYKDYGHAIPPQIRQARTDAFLTQFLKT